jgi:hypothetical protein
MFSLQTIIDEIETIERNTLQSRLGGTYVEPIVSDLEKGHAIMNAVRASLRKFDTLKMTRSKDQRLMQRRCMAGIASFVYGPAVKTHEKEIKQYNNFETLHQGIANSLPRRGGKTTWVAQWCAAVLHCVPGIEICLIASNRRAAGGDSGITGKVLANLGTLGWNKFYKKGEECIFISPKQGDIRKYHCYPGGATHKYGTFFFP